MKTLCVFLLGIFLAASCQPEERRYPLDISFTEYSIEQIQCRWQNLPYNDKVIIINSTEDLEKYIECSDDNYAAIDFTNHSLLLASGRVTYYPNKIIEIGLQQILENEYTLYLKIRIGVGAAPSRWDMSLIVPKLLQDDIITLNVQQIRP